MNDRYPMTSDQIAQIDCRVTSCEFNIGGGDCVNSSPAITLSETGKFACWSSKVSAVDDANFEKNLVRLTSITTLPNSTTEAEFKQTVDEMKAGGVDAITLKGVGVKTQTMLDGVEIASQCNKEEFEQTGGSIIIEAIDLIPYTIITFAIVAVFLNFAFHIEWTFNSTVGGFALIAAALTLGQRKMFKAMRKEKGIISE